MKNHSLANEAAYGVGALLYAPATKDDMARKILENEIPLLTAVAFCLEDAVLDSELSRAEMQLVKTLLELSVCDSSSDLPMTFVRVRNPEHLLVIANRLHDHGLSVTGFVLPKFDLSNAGRYMDAMAALPDVWRDAPYMMPILESRAIASPLTRMDELDGIKSILDENKGMVLNVRVGGNDLCSLYGVRRSWNQNIYQVGAVRDALADIIAVFGIDYVVSGPVWDYFGIGDDSRWKTGLETELSLDRLNGFIGKTAIHPCQVPVIIESLRVERSDYEDALAILGGGDSHAVTKSHSGLRMDETKTHVAWARRTVHLAKTYGVKN